MKKFLMLLAALVMILLSGCAGSAPTVAEKKVFYTQVNMWYVEKSYKQKQSAHDFSVSRNEDALASNYRIDSTNYKRDYLIPINSPVEIVESDDYAIFFIYQNKLIAMENIARHTKIDTAKLLERSFKEEKVDLSMYTPERRAEITKGKIVKGMSKATVLLARGYPPEHKTPDLQSDNWRYWNGKFNSRMFHFEEGKYVTFTD